jgi:hypothetical protein
VKTVTEVFPDVTLWETFDEDCKQAEAVRDCSVEDATRERDRVVRSDPNWKVHSRDRINASAEARRARKVNEAHEKYDAACKRAEEYLMKALDQREANDRREARAQREFRVL